MNLEIQDKNFLVLGASSGFGRYIAERISREGGHPILVARSADKLRDFQKSHPDSSFIVADLMKSEGLQSVIRETNNITLDGVLINAGGPPAGSFPQKMEEWDGGYNMVLRWKIELLQSLLPRFEARGYGRIVFIESVSVREPIPGLVLSNVFRMAVVGMMKSIVNEMTGQDILINMIAPGYHLTDRLENLIKRKSQEQGIPEEEIANQFAENTPLRKLGDPANLAELAVWLLSPGNGYVTGQVIPVDGGLAKGL
ncbi:MAG TPA: SDR family oxidoreductase [Membranihabitans sp.]|nr:SDR family oxidoreductase [Membranihabitans sp.]